MISLTMMGLNPDPFGTCAFTFRFEESIGYVDDSVDNICGVRPIIFFTTGIY